MVYVYDDIDMFSKEQVEKYQSIISMQRKHKIDNLFFEEEKQKSILTFLLLRYALYVEYGFTEIPVFEFNRNGKPYLKNKSNICFNISHCDCSIMCGLSNLNIGVDVQEYVKYEAEIFDFILNDREKSKIIDSLDRDKSFTTIWTLKESYGKYLGEGITYDLTTTRFVNHESGWFKQYKCQFYTKREKTYCYAICSDKTIKIVKVRYFDFVNVLQILLS